ncbi:Uncharacterised protein [Mycobacteroides abscessus]|nr:Uncharacterised protein [Mycobacteroides abscessus]
MLSPRTRATASSPTNSSPRTNAWASPFGSGCTVYSIEMPNCEPSPRRRRNWSASCGVVMTSTSRIPARISVESG